MFRSTLDTLMTVREEKAAARENGDAGFTLIEMLVVVVIIGILVAIAIPLYLNYESGAKTSSVKADVRDAVTAIQSCYGDNNNALPTPPSSPYTSTTALTGVTPSGGTNPCAGDQIVVSSGSTKSITFTVTGSNFVVTGLGNNGSTVTYTSATGQFTG